MGAVEAFEVIPAVDVADGQVVQLVGGERGTERSYGEPVAAAERWLAAGATTLHLVDLDGAFEGERRNADAIDAVVETTGDRARVHLGGGIRTAEEAISLLNRGVDRVILGTAAVENPGIVADVSDRHPDGVIVSLDVKGGEVVVEGWTEESGLRPSTAAQRYANLGAAAILCTNVDVEGRMQGVETRVIERLVRSTELPVIASGGVASIDDLRALRDAGAVGAVVGTALYEGGIDLAAARAALEANETGDGEE